MFECNVAQKESKRRLKTNIQGMWAREIKAEPRKKQVQTLR
jgi:hypothetical protein